MGVAHFRADDDVDVGIAPSVSRAAPLPEHVGRVVLRPPHIPRAHRLCDGPPRALPGGPRSGPLGCAVQSNNAGAGSSALLPLAVGAARAGSVGRVRAQPPRRPCSNQPRYGCLHPRIQGVQQVGGHRRDGRAGAARARALPADAHRRRVHSPRRLPAEVWPRTAARRGPAAPKRAPLLRNVGRWRGRPEGARNDHARRLQAPVAARPGARAWAQHVEGAVLQSAADGT